MMVTVKLSEDQARRLKTRDALHGQHVEDYLLDHAEREDHSYEAWRAWLKALPERLSKGMPSLPEEALRREMMYGE